jgi:hypothetical protein
MATLWSVTRPDIAVPLLMKIPRMSEGDDPAAIVGFEMGQMILPRLSGPHVPVCFGAGDLARQPYVVIERIPGKTLYGRLPDLPLPFEEAVAITCRLQQRLPICTGNMSSTTISSPAASCSVPAAKPC